MSINFSELKRKEIRTYIETNDKNNPIEIYEPSNDQRMKILELLTEGIKVDKDKISAKINDEDILLVLLDELTNIHLDLDKDRDKDLIENILNDPSTILIKVKMEIEKLVNEVFYIWYDLLKELGKMPEDLKEAYLISINQPKKEDISEEEKELAELEKRIAEIKSKKEEK